MRERHAQQPGRLSGENFENREGGWVCCSKIVRPSSIYEIGPRAGRATLTARMLS
jgi:hypothetical protein